MSFRKAFLAAALAVTFAVPASPLAATTAHAQPKPGATAPAKSCPVDDGTSYPPGTRVRKRVTVHHPDGSTTVEETTYVCRADGEWVEVEKRQLSPSGRVAHEVGRVSARR
jgi:hypothetical protein